VASNRLPTLLALAIPSAGRSTRVSEEIRNLILKMKFENAGSGAPKIHGELLKLGFNISERTVARYLQSLRPRTRKRDQRWKAFLANHREAIVAFDFFAVPTLTFKLLYAFLIIEHGRRKILHCDVTAHPTSEWVVQQLKEAFPEADPYRYVIFDHDSKFNCDVIQLLTSTGLQPKRTSIQSPGKTELRNAGSEVAAGSSWTTSSR
jgi:putative transposase